MADKAWKAFERRVSAFFGGVRCPVLGTDTKADVNHDTLFIECKQRQKHSVVSLWDATKIRAGKKGSYRVRHAGVLRHGCGSSARHLRDAARVAVHFNRWGEEIFKRDGQAREIPRHWQNG